MKAAWDDAAHLLRRAGFGGRPEEIEQVVHDGLEASVERLLHPPPAEPLPVPKSLIDAQAAWIHRMRHTPHVLQEKMTLFWHGHFATSFYKVDRPELLSSQIDLLRRLAFADFAEMTRSIARDPAMVWWLDNNANHKDAPNENFARELMELFTIGLVRYTEQDVHEAARAFTGWGVRYDATDHDGGDKTFLGMTGAWNGDDVIGMLVDLPECARFLAGKLCAFFGPLQPSAALLRALAHTYVDRDRSMLAVMRKLLLAEEFYQDRFQHVKSPVEFVVGSARLLDSAVSDAELAEAATRMGQELFNPPTVKGWDGDMTWISATSMMERINLAARLARDVPDPVKRLLQRPVARQMPTDPVRFVLSLPEYQMA